MGSSTYPTYGYNTSDNAYMNNLAKESHGRMDPGTSIWRYSSYDSSQTGAKIGFPTLDPDNKSQSGGSEAYTKAQHRDIETIYHQIMSERPEALSALGDIWVRAGQLLQHVGDELKKETSPLVGDDGHGGTWDSDGARAFAAMGPGATFKSINDWIPAVQNNAKGMHYVADKVPGYQQQMQALWDQYTKVMGAVTNALTRIADAQDYKSFANASDDFYHAYNSAFGKGDHNGFPGGMIDQYHSINTAAAKAQASKNASTMADLNTAKQNMINYVLRPLQQYSQGDFNHKAQQLAFKMAGDYSVGMNYLNQGTAGTFEGPHNAVNDNPMNYKPAAPTGPAGGPTAPGLNTPNLTSAPKPEFNLTTTPTAPPALTPQQLQQQQQAQQQAEQLAKQQAPLTGPTAPPALTGLLATNPALASNPALEVALGTAPLTAPNAQGLLGNSRVLGAAKLSGLNSAAARSAPAAPEAEGASASRPPGVPSSLANNRRPPGLRGPNSNAPEEPEMSRPGRPGTTPPVLNNRRPGTRGPAGGPEEPEMGRPGSTRPGTTPPVLNNRRPGGRGPNMPEEQEPELGGRPGTGRPGTTPPVLNPRGKDRKPGEPTEGRPVREIDAFGRMPTEPGMTPPVLRGPEVTGPYSSDLEEVPGSIRGTARVPGSSPVRSGPPEQRPDLAARHKPAGKPVEAQQQAAEERDEPRIVTDEDAWTVQTPGGPVVANEPKREANQTEAGPSLGLG